MAADETSLYRETNARFWDRSGYKPGQNLNMRDPKDRAQAKHWLRIYDEVRQHRARAMNLARSIYGETFTPSILIVEKPDGSVAHELFQQRPYLDAKYKWLLEQPDLYGYTAMFDFAEDARGPLADQFSAVVRQRAAAQEAAVALLQEQARALARRSNAGIVGVARDPRGPWYTPTFTNRAEVWDWFRRATANPNNYTYAAFFDKAHPPWPSPLSESISTRNVKV